jgi:hypothetical protein
VPEGVGDAETLEELDTLGVSDGEAPREMVGVGVDEMLALMVELLEAVREGEGGAVCVEVGVEVLEALEDGVTLLVAVLETE